MNRLAFALVGLAACSSSASSGSGGGGHEDAAHAADSGNHGDAGKKDSGGDTTTGDAKDDAMGDGTTHDGESSDGMTHDSTSPTDSGGAGVQCHEDFGDGSTEICGYASSTAPGYTCESGFTPGTCSSSGLYGCCVVTGIDAGVTSVAAVCYYSSTSGETAMEACTGSDEKWVTTAP
jgi:hypothetical protein